MLRIRLPALAALLFLAALPAIGHAQEWNPPSRQMPNMPRASEIGGGWLSASGTWFSGVASLAGVSLGDLSVAGDGRSGSGQVQVVRVTSGPLPVAVWQDRNGDGRADIIEIFRSGGVVVQVIDAEYDGQANVVRRYDANGGLVREDRL